MADSDNVLRARNLLRAHSVAELPSVERFSSKREGSDDTFFSAMLEAAFLVTAADGELSVEEAGSLVDVIAQVGGETITPGQLAESVHEFSAMLEKDGRPARIEALSNAITDPGARREVLGFASLVALCDHELAPSELYVLHSIGKGFGFDSKAVNGIIKSVREAMGE
jgi:tellurite resistance protein